MSDDSGSTSQPPSLTGTSAISDATSVATIVGARELDKTNFRLEHVNGRLERYIQDPEDWACNLLARSEKQLLEPEVPHAHYVSRAKSMIKHVDHVFKNGIEIMEECELHSYIPDNEPESIAAFGARIPLPSGENTPWELKTGRSTTQPRRPNAKRKPKEKKMTTNLPEQAKPRPNARNSGSIEGPSKSVATTFNSQILNPSITRNIPPHSQPLLLQPTCDQASRTYPPIAILVPSIVAETPAPVSSIPLFEDQYVTVLDQIPPSVAHSADMSLGYTFTPNHSSENAPPLPALSLSDSAQISLEPTPAASGDHHSPYLTAIDTYIYSQFNEAAAEDTISSVPGFESSSGASPLESSDPQTPAPEPAIDLPDGWSPAPFLPSFELEREMQKE